MKLNIKKLHPDAIVPQYASAGAMCFDLHAIDDTDYDGIAVYVSHTFRTGLSFEIPPGFGMFIFSRSGHGFKNDTRLANCVGVIDSDYRGEVMVKLTNDSLVTGGAVAVKKGDRIAQAVIMPYERVEFVESEELAESARGVNGFGSTGQGKLNE